MKFTLASAKLTGNPGPSGWTQIHEFRPEDEEKLKKRGCFFAVISTETAFGRELLTRLHEEYFGNLDASAFIALKRAVASLWLSLALRLPKKYMHIASEAAMQT